MSRYIDLDRLIFCLEDEWAWCSKKSERGLRTAMQIVKEQPIADVVEVVRCKDCKYFQPAFVLTADGERRPYTDEEIKNGKIVTLDIGINCGSRCERYWHWRGNKVPVFMQENDYCSYAERREE